VVALVLLPGLDGTGLLFTDFIAALPPDIEPVVVSYPNDPTLGYMELEAVARAKLPAQPFILLGESFSGPIAISIAASAPTWLCGLVLCCSFARNPHQPLGWVRWLKRVLPAHAPAVVLNWLLLGRFSSARLTSALTQALAKVAPATLRARIAAILTVDVTARLASVRVPVVYLRATEDRVVPISASLLIRQLCPATAVTEVAAPHFLLQAAPTVAARHVVQFVHHVGKP
jgi:pimeloyl-[acyl-carrier protein] methyl ester esterase